MALLIGGCIPSKDWKVHDGIYLCVFSYYEADTRAFLRSEYVLAPRSGEPRTRRDPARPTPSSVGTRSGQEDRILCGYSVLGVDDRVVLHKTRPCRKGRVSIHG